jgi:hypothetical protein
MLVGGPSSTTGVGINRANSYTSLFKPYDGFGEGFLRKIVPSLLQVKDMVNILVEDQGFFGEVC